MSVHACTGFLIILALLTTYHNFAAGRCSHHGRGLIDSTEHCGGEPEQVATMATCT